MGIVYKSVFLSSILCFFILILRPVLFPVFLGKEVLIGSAVLISSSIKALLYGSICTWVYRSTFGEKPNAVFFFIAALVVFLFHYIGYLRVVSGPETGTVHQWGELFLSKGHVQPIGFLYYALNPFFVLLAYTSTCLLKSRLAQK